MLLKRLLLAWINSALPGNNITNFTTDWRDGRNLSALVDYCKPGLIPDHASLDPKNAETNIRNALHFAEIHLGVAFLIETEDLAVEKPDERSLMTYLSQFCSSSDSPGLKALLVWLQQQLPDGLTVSNLSSDWVDGRLLGALVDSITEGKFPSYGEMNPDNALQNCQEGLNVAEKLLGAKKIICAEQFISADLDVLSRLSYLSQFYYAKQTQCAPGLIPAAAHKVDVSQLQIPTSTGADKYLWLELDCCDAGYGEVRAEAEGRDSGKVDVDIEEIQDEKHRVMFKTLRVDIYKLAVFYGDNHVCGSPFSINLYPPDPEKVKHVTTDIPSDAKREVELGFDTTEAGRGKLKALGNGEIIGKIPITVEQQSDGMFLISFTPPCPDLYTVDVLWGKFSAFAIGECTGVVPLRVDQDHKSEYKVSFTPPNPDVYTVDVNWEGKPVPGSPFTIDLLPPGRAEEVECTPPLYTVPGDDVDMLVDATSAGSGDISSDCTGEESGNVAVEITKITGRTHQVSFRAPKHDIYSLSVKFGDSHVKGSPFTIDMRPGVTPDYGVIEESETRGASVAKEVSEASQCKIIGLADTQRLVFIDQSTEFSVDTSDAGPGELDITVEGSAVSQHPPKLNFAPNKDDGNIYDITFRPSVTGHYALNLAWFNDPIPRSPVTFIAVDPKSIPTVIYGKLASTECDIDCKQSDLKAYTVHDETNTQVRTKITKVQRGRYKISFQPKLPGLYRIHVSVKDREIPESPIIVRYGKPAKPDGVTVSGLGERCYINEPLTATIDTTDAGSGELTVRATAPKQKKDKTDVAFVDHKDGKYSFDFTPTSIGDHQFAISWAGKPIPGSPFHSLAVDRLPDAQTGLYLVSQPSTASESFAEIGTEPYSATIGQGVLLRVTIQRKELRNELTATAVGENTGSTQLSITKRSDDVYDVLLNPTHPDRYAIVAELDGNELPRSPITVTYTQLVTDVSKCKVVGVDSLTPPFYVNKTIGFQVETKDAGPGALEAVVDLPLDREDTPNLELKPNTAEKDVYDVSYIPAVPGTHKIHLAWDKEKIPDSPLVFEVFEPPSIAFGKPIAMDFNVDAKQSDLDAHGIHLETNTRYKVKISKAQKGKYKLNFQPKDPGYYHIHVFVKQTEASNSPFVVKYTSPSRPEKCTVRDIPSSVVVGDPITFVVDATEAGGGEVNVKASLPASQNGTKPDLRINNRKDGTYLVELVSSVSGAHQFDVLWSGHSIPQSPFQVPVVEPLPLKPDTDTDDLMELLNEMAVTSPLQDEPFEIATDVGFLESGAPLPVPVDETAEEKPVRPRNEITIMVGKALRLKVRPQTEEQRNSKLDARVTGEDTGPGEVKVSQHEDGVFEVYFNPPEADHYVLEAKLDGEEVPKSPFYIHYVPAPPPVRVERTSSPEPGQPLDFNLDLGSVGTGKITACCEGEKSGSVPVGVFEQDDKKQRVSFTPVDPDLYNLSIFFNDRHIKGSPFTYDTRPKEVTEPDGEEGLIKVIEPLFDIRPQPTEEASYLLHFHEDSVESLEQTPEPEPLTLDSLVDGSEEEKPEGPIAEFTNYIGRSLLVKVRPKNEHQRNGEVTASIVGERSGPSKAVIVKTPEETFEVTINPKEADRYTVDVKLNDEQVPRTPFIVNYIEPPIDASKCKIIGVDDLPAILEANQEVSLTVDVKDAGPGQLEVVSDTAHKEDEASKPSVQRSRHEAGLYDVTYTPLSAGRHTLTFKWSEKMIPQSPVNLLVAEMDKVPTFYHGKPATFDIDCDCRQSELRAYVLHKGTGTQPRVKISKIQKGKFKFSFQPKEPGHYFLHVFVRDTELARSPFIFYYGRPAKPEAVKVLDLDRSVYKDEPTTFTVDASEAGDGELVVRPLIGGKERGTVSVDNKRDGTYTVDFTPSEPGKYQIPITWSGKAIPGSPFAISVKDQTEEELITHLLVVDRVGRQQNINFPDEDRKGEVTAATDSSLLLTVKPRTDQQKNSELTATATGEKSGVHNLRVSKSGAVFEALFSPPTADRFTIQANLGSEPVPHTPFDVVYTTAVAKPAEVKIIHLESIPQLLQVDKPIHFAVDTRLAGEGKLNISADPPPGSERPKLKAKANSEEPRIIDITYTPTTGGKHVVKTMWAGEEVPQSPLSFDVESVQLYPNGKPVALELNTEADRARELESFAIHQETGTKYRVKISKVSKGKFRFSFQPKSPGLYGVHVLLKKKEITSSPLYIRYEGPARPEAVVIRDTPETAYLKETYTFTVDTSNAGSSELQVNIIPPSKGKDGELRIVNNKDKTFTVNHTPIVVGDHQFQIFWAGRQLPGRLTHIDVTKRQPIVRNSLAGRVNVVRVGQLVSLHVTNISKDEDKEKDFLQVVLSALENDKDKATVVKQQDGTYLISFTPSQADDYTLSVKLHNEHIDQSPFYIKAVDDAALSSAFKHPQGVCHSDVETGHAVNVVIPKREEDDASEYTVSVDGPEGPCDATISDQLMSSFGVNFLPPVAGDYLCHIKKGDKEIENSPFKVTAFEKEPDAHKVFIAEDVQRQFSVAPLPLGFPTRFVVDAHNAGLGDLKVLPRGTGKADVKVSDNADHTYGCELNPREQGQCDLDILWNDDHIPGSPFKLSFVAVTGVDFEGQSFHVGAPYQFSVGYNQVRDGLLEIACSPPSAGEVRIVPSADGKAYDCVLIPKETGEKEISVQYNGIHTVGSPFHVHFQEPSATNISFSLTARGAETSNVTATAQSTSTFESVPVSLTELFGGNYAIELVPQEGLEYLLTIKCLVKIQAEQKVVVGSPFQLAYAALAIDASKVCVEGIGASQAEIGVWSSFFVETRGAGNGELGVSFEGGEGPSDKPEVTIQAVSNTRFEVKYLLNSTGVYAVRLQWSGKDIPGSPLEIKCSQAKASSHFNAPELPKNVELGAPLEFSLTPSGEPAEGELIVTARAKHRHPVSAVITRGEEGRYDCLLQLEQTGKYHVMAMWNGVPIKGAPFEVRVTQPPIAANVKAAGPGLSDGVIGHEGSFVINTTDSGSGTLSVNVEGPKGGFKINMERHPKQERLILARYDPQNAGEYVINITWAGEAIPGSPFIVNIAEP